jgi:hypothetical protein
VFLSLLHYVVAPNTRSGREYGTDRHHSRQSRTPTMPYNVESRPRQSDWTRRESRRGRATEDEISMVSYPHLLQPAHENRGRPTRDGRRDRGRDQRPNPPACHLAPRPNAALPRQSEAQLEANPRPRIQWWDNPLPVWPLSGGPRLVPPPRRSDGATAPTSDPQSSNAGAMPTTSLVALTNPPPPQWRVFLRDLVISLGYAQAVVVWPRTARFANGNFGPNARIYSLRMEARISVTLNARLIGNI